MKKYLMAALMTLSPMGGCATATTADGKRIEVSYEEVILGNGPHLGNHISKLLKNEFDHVGYYKNKNGDLVIRGHEKVEGSYLAVWGINLDEMCKTYLIGTPFVDYIVGRNIIADHANGAVASYNMNKGTATKLAKVFEFAIKREGNKQRCEAWKDLILQNYGPFGPDDADI